MTQERFLGLMVWVLVAILAVAPLAVVVEGVAFSLERPGLVALIERAGPICHHIPERTLVADGRPLPVCARCTGLYLGTALGGLLGYAVGRRRWLAASLASAGVLAAIGGLAGVAEALGLVSTSNAARVVLGLPLGLGPMMVGGLGIRVLVDELRGS